MTCAQSRRPLRALHATETSAAPTSRAGRCRRGARRIAGLLLAAAATAPLAAEPHSSHSVARQWNELQLQAIRKDYDDPAALGNRIAKRVFDPATRTAPTNSAATRSSTTTLP